MKLRSKEQDLEATTFQKDELLLKVSNLEEKVNGYKHKLLALEKKVTEQESEKDFLFGKEVTQTHKMRHLENTIKSLDQQVKDMEKALEESEQRCSALARERQEWAHKKA
jgi:chromosome segregation ATPase